METLQSKNQLCQIPCIFFKKKYFFVVLETEIRASHMLGKCFITEPHPQLQTQNYLIYRTHVTTHCATSLGESTDSPLPCQRSWQKAWVSVAQNLLGLHCVHPSQTTAVQNLILAGARTRWRWNPTNIPNF